jgi:hypothetical protein
VGEQVEVQVQVREVRVVRAERWLVTCSNGKQQRCQQQCQPWNCEFVSLRAQTFLCLAFPLRLTTLHLP